MSDNDKKTPDFEALGPAAVVAKLLVAISFWKHSKTIFYMKSIFYQSFWDPSFLTCKKQLKTC